MGTKLEQVMTFREQVLKACELAEWPGECRYTKDDKSPCCIVAQYIHLGKHNINLFEFEHEIFFADPNEHTQKICKRSIWKNHPICSKQEAQLLQRLQVFWDNNATNKELIEYATKLLDKQGF